MTDERSTRALVDRARQGDSEAFGELFDLFRERLRRLVGSRLNAHAAEAMDAEDVVQESLVRGLQSVASFRWQGEESFLRWLGGIAEHVIVDLVRHTARRPETTLDFEVSGRDGSPSQGLRRDERFDRLQAALDDLSPDYRKVIVLARLKRLPIKEVARRMDRSPEAVSQLLIRAARKMKERMGHTESLSLPAKSLEEKDQNDD